MRRAGFLTVAAALLLAACDGSASLIHHDPKPPGPFPAADRPVAHIVSARWSTEEDRDRMNEAGEVMARSGIGPGMTVADIGAGEGYYTVRLAARVGKDGRVLAEDIFANVRDALADRVARERLDNVSVRLGSPADPRLPPASFDRVVMVHMYHEIEQPYEFLWRMRPSLKPDRAGRGRRCGSPDPRITAPRRAVEMRIRRGRLPRGGDPGHALRWRLSRRIPRGGRPPGTERDQALPDALTPVRTRSARR